MNGSSLEVDATLCDGVGMCVLLAPDIVTLDRWGFPVVGPVVDRGTARQARAAARGCPHRALSVVDKAERG